MQCSNFSLTFQYYFLNIIAWWCHIVTDAGDYGLFELFFWGYVLGSVRNIGRVARWLSPKYRTLAVLVSVAQNIELLTHALSGIIIIFTQYIEPKYRTPGNPRHWLDPCISCACVSRFAPPPMVAYLSDWSLALARSIPGDRMWSPFKRSVMKGLAWLIHWKISKVKAIRSLII